MSSEAMWRDRVEEANDAWAPVRAAALDADTVADIDELREQTTDVVPDTDAVLTQAQLIGLLQEHARSGDTIIAAAGGPPGDLLKVWDATDGRECHLEFGFSCMGYEIPAAIGVRLATPDPAARVISFLGDGTFLMAPTELVTAAQEKLPITLVVPGEPRLPGHPPAADVHDGPRSSPTSSATARTRSSSRPRSPPA